MGSEILKNLSTDPCAIIFESKLPTDSVVSEAKMLAKSDEVLILLKDEKWIEKRLLPAYLNAYLRNQEEALHSKTLSLETILFTAGSMNITDAIAKVCAKKNRFMLFSSRRKLAGKLAKSCKLKKISERKLFLDENIASDVAMTAIKDYK